MLENRQIGNTKKNKKRTWQLPDEKLNRYKVNNKITESQITKLSTIMGAGAALNKNKDRQNANEQIFLNNLRKKSHEKGQNHHQFNWACGKKLPAC